MMKKLIIFLVLTLMPYGTFAAVSNPTSNCSKPSFFCSKSATGVKVGNDTVAQLYIVFNGSGYKPSQCSTSGASGWSTLSVLNLIRQYYPQYQRASDQTLDTFNDVYFSPPVKQLTRFSLTCAGKVFTVDVDVPGGKGGAAPGVPVSAPETLNFTIQNPVVTPTYAKEVVVAPYQPLALAWDAGKDNTICTSSAIDVSRINKWQYPDGLF